MQEQFIEKNTDSVSPAAFEVIAECVQSFGFNEPQKLDRSKLAVTDMKKKLTELMDTLKMNVIYPCSYGMV